LSGDPIRGVEAARGVALLAARIELDPVTLTDNAGAGE